MTKVERLMLFNMSGISPANYRKLLDKYGALANIKQEEIDRLFDKKKLLHKDLDNELKQVKKEGVKVLTLEDEEYPASLKYISDPPYILYFKGTLKKEDSISIGVVGCRNPTVYGKLCTEKFTTKLLQRGFTVISGLARGVDTVCHNTAVKLKQRNIAVMGSGFSRLYPKENRQLAEEIAACGAVVSEFSMFTEPDRFNFPRRNRIISGMSLGTLVVEAGEASGALITARYALEQCREVFALPGNITSELSRGTNALIKQGAKLVTCIEDVIEELKDALPEEFLNVTGQAELGNVVFTDIENRVFVALGSEPMHIDEITSKTLLASKTLASVLISLEIKGFIKQFQGKMFAKLI